MRILFLLAIAAISLQAAGFQGGKTAKSASLVHTDSPDLRPDVRTISGQVFSLEGHELLEGVRVVVKGCDRFSGSWQDGAYYMPVKAEDSVLVFSLPGYETREIRLGRLNEYTVVLRKADLPQAQALTAGIAGSRTEGQIAGSRTLAEGQTAGIAGSRTEGQIAGSRTLAEGQGQPRMQLPAGFSAIGKWRGVFQVRPDLEVPFNFEILRTDKDGVRVFFLNAEEHFDGGRVVQTKDSLLIWLDQFDNELAFAIRDNASLSGVLRRQDGKGMPVPVTAETGKSYRFAAAGNAPAGNISGTYDIVFHSADGKEEKAVGLLQQDGSRLRGTFLRVTGDSRYLEGIVEGDHFYLSSFIGSGPSFYRGSFTADGQLSGEIEGARGSQHFTGVSNASAALPDPYKLTYLKEGYNTLDFSFPDVDGHAISPKDEKFRNKVVVITIGGTWCPNCVDEAGFLAPWYKANHARGVEIISLQYERQADPGFVKKVLTRQRERFGIEYDQVFAGLADKQGVAASLPALNSFLSFPTTIILDRKGKVAEIHTGYTGPATGKYYEDFVKDFNAEIDRLLKG